MFYISVVIVMILLGNVLTCISSSFFINPSYNLLVYSDIGTLLQLLSHANYCATFFFDFQISSSLLNSFKKIFVLFFFFAFLNKQFRNFQYKGKKKSSFPPKDSWCQYFCMFHLKHVSCWQRGKREDIYPCGRLKIEWGRDEDKSQT